MLLLWNLTWTFTTSLIWSIPVFVDPFFLIEQYWGAIIDAIIVPILNRKLEEYFAKWKEEGLREMRDKAIANAKPEFLKVIESNRREIQAAQAQGHLVYLYIVIETGYADSTDRDPFVGSGASSGYWPYVVNIVDIQVVYEGEKPRPYIPDTNRLGDLIRTVMGIKLEYSNWQIPL